jgi:hypothetical protein
LIGVDGQQTKKGGTEMKIIVTDLTRFGNRDIVCMAGIDQDSGVCVRPMLPSPNGLRYFGFQTVKDHKIIPGSCLEGNFAAVPNSAAPHVEDHSAVGQLRLAEAASGAAFEAVLEQSSFTSVGAAFGALPVNRLFGLVNPPKKSIITLKLKSPRTQFNLISDRYNPEKFKAHVTDDAGYELSWLPVTDLGFSDHVTAIRATDPQLHQLNGFLQSQKTIYLRIGLARQYASGGRDGYWVQLNGIYSFPDFRRDLRIYD